MFSPVRRLLHHPALERFVAALRVAAKPKLLDRYIVREILGSFAGVLLVSYFLFFMGQVLRLAEWVIVNHVPGWVVLKMSAFILLSLSAFVLPIGFLGSTLIGFGRLSNDSEVVALKASGMSLWQIGLPVVRFSVAVVGVSWILLFFVSPWAEKSLGETMMRVGGSQITITLKEKTFNAGFFDLLLYADEIDPDTGHMKHVFIYDERESREPLVVVAKDGVLRRIATNSPYSGQVVLRLLQGKIYRINPSESAAQVIGFERDARYLRIQEGEVGALDKPRMKTAIDLLAEMIDYPKDHQGYRDRATEFFKRFFIGLAPMVFVFMGLGWGVTRGRVTQGRGVLITMATIVVFYTALIWFNAMGNDNRMNLVLALAMPDILVAIIAGIGFKKAAW